MKRRVFKWLSILSLLVAICVLSLWVLSYRGDGVDWSYSSGVQPARGVRVSRGSVWACAGDWSLATQPHISYYSGPVLGVEGCALELDRAKNEQTGEAWTAGVDLQLPCWLAFTLAIILPAVWFLVYGGERIRTATPPSRRRIRIRLLQWSGGFVAILVAFYGLLALVSGTAAPRRAPMTPQVNWISGSDFAWPPYTNFYMEDRKYPGYGIAQYDVDQRWYKLKYEGSYLIDAALQCRESFLAAFQSGSLGRWEDNWAHPPGYVPFHPDYVVLVIVNRAEAFHYDTSRNCYKVAIVLHANELFAPRTDVAALVSRAARDREPFIWERGDDGGTPPVGQMRYLVIERHIKSRTTVPATGLAN
jgi:hypothetical protein